MLLRSLPFGQLALWLGIWLLQLAASELDPWLGLWFLRRDARRAFPYALLRLTLSLVS